MKLPRHAEIWLPGYLRSLVEGRRARRRVQGVTDILLCVADHYEPLHGQVSSEVGLRRVRAWREAYPRLFSGLRDADGRPPRHTFFFPIEQYAPEYLEPLAELTREGFAEVEIHLHHDGDTSANLRQELTRFTRLLHERHGLLSRDAQGNIRYAFVHGNWALDNSLPDGRWCGVNDEIQVLLDTGCYADFTMPAAPSPAQVRTVNRIYYAADDPRAPRSHERGVQARVGRPASGNSLLMVQGPLGLTWRRAKWWVLPRMEDAAIHGQQPPTLVRLADWLDAGIGVAGRPEWVFVKLHTHGAPEGNARVLLGAAMVEFHRQLLAAFNDGRRWRVHYVTAREMANIVHAAEEGHEGNPGAYRDFGLPSVATRANAAAGAASPAGA